MDPEMNMRIIYKICPENEDQGKPFSFEILFYHLVESNGGYTDNLWVPHYGTHR